MPFIRTGVHRDTTQQQRQAIADGIHQALVTSIGMPEDELFNMMTEYEPQYRTRAHRNSAPFKHP